MTKNITIFIYFIFYHREIVKLDHFMTVSLSYANTVLWCSRCKIHRFVAAPFILTQDIEGDPAEDIHDHPAEGDLEGSQVRVHRQDVHNLQEARDHARSEQALNINNKLTRKKLQNIKNSRWVNCDFNATCGCCLLRKVFMIFFRTIACELRYLDEVIIHIY